MPGESTNGWGKCGPSRAPVYGADNEAFRPVRRVNVADWVRSAGRVAQAG